MQISVIIVNYNVEYFLEQCLNSVFVALKNIKGEVFVVDNNSIDGSVLMVKEKFPQVNLIANKNNAGFSKANNQAIKMSSGKYILLLNPDTVVEEDTLSKCINFMDKNADAGGLGVKMIDGKGKFLPESKRGLPTPAVAFYKIFGLSKLFPKSKTFGKYHLGYLDKNETNEIEILSGAYMMMRKSVLDKVGLLDETFFMYGEDIDLSYRILKGGFKNYYFSQTQIIHYKGESTKKSSINYVFVFYRAMIIFAEKHFSQKNAKLFSISINLAIYLRAGLAILSRFLKKMALPAIDFIVILSGLYFTTKFWSMGNIDFPQHILKYALPSYTSIWLLGNLYAGAYDYPAKLKSFFIGTLSGTAVILIIYALLPKEIQFSRLFILSGGGIALTYFLLSRFIFSILIGGKFNLKGISNKNFAVVGDDDEVLRVRQILKNTPHKVKNIFTVSPLQDKSKDAIGTLNQLDQIIDIHKIDEVIFCAKNTTAENIIRCMTSTNSGKKIEFKIAQPNSMFLIGSNSIDTAGDLYLMDINNISTGYNKRNKRTFDVLLASSMLLLSPVFIWFYKNKVRFLKNCIQVLSGKKTWVGYTYDKVDFQHNLPQIKKGILTPAEKIESNIGSSLLSKLNLIYAKDYTIFKDFKIVSENWKSLDR